MTNGKASEYQIKERLAGEKICPFMTKKTKREYKGRMYCQQEFCALWVKAGDYVGDCCFKFAAVSKIALNHD